ncbi:MAG: NgoPII family restriction endonuclease [Thermoplasmataceae archaeon]
MAADVLEAMQVIARERNCNLKEHGETYSIRINSAGASLEYYIKDALSGNFYPDEGSREDGYRKNFAWLGNQNNPPDAIARGGDAFEIKKLQSPRNIMALNSSPPKDVLHRDDSRIVEACRNCDGGAWQQKDIFYAIGWLHGYQIRSLYFVQGSCYAASREVYESVSSRLSENINGAISSSGLEAGETDELGRINRVDPLGITSLRVRGMWQIENPSRVFQSVAALDPEKRFQGFAIMKWKKYLQLFDIQRNYQLTPIKLTKAKLPNPNNPAEAMEVAVLEASW